MQTISNRFAAHVYETHARIALESGDLPEYNQVRTCLIDFTLPVYDVILTFFVIFLYAKRHH